MPKNVKIFAIAGTGTSVPTARIELTGLIGLDNNTSEYFTTEINALLDKGVQDVLLYMNTGGGDLFAANEIANQIKRFPGKKMCEIGALCASAGTMVSSEMDYVIAAKNLNFMLHNPILNVVMECEEDFASSLQMYQNCRNQAIDSYVAKTKLSREEIINMMNVTTWLTAEQALAKGFIDEISGTNDILPADTKEVFAKMQYKGVPQILNQAITKPDHTNMKKIALKLGLPEDATEDQIVAELDKQSIASVQNTDEGIKLLASIGEKKGFKKETISALAKSNFANTVELVMSTADPIATPAEGAAAATPDTGRMADVVKMLTDKIGASQAPAVAMSFSEMLEKDRPGLKALVASNPTQVQALYNKEYDFMPNIEELKAII